MRKGRMEYLVKWDDETPKPACWVWMGCLGNAVEKIAEYERGLEL